MKENQITKSEIIDSITDFLFIGKKSDELEVSDLVIVLGNSFPQWTASEMHRLYQEKVIMDTAKIILTGATGALNAGQESECEQMYKYAVNELHMPEGLFVKDSKATNASENLKYSKELIEEMGGFDSFNKILFIGCDFMLRRVSMYAAKQNYPMEKLQYFGVVNKDGRNIGRDTWWETDVSRERVMAEIERIGKYYKTGDLGLD